MATKEVYAVALRLLSRREHAVAELRAKLSARGFPEVDIDFTLEQLIAEKAVSDARFAESLVRWRISQGRGSAIIRQELKTWLVSDDTIEAAFAASESDWTALAMTVRERRFGAEKPADFQQLLKQKKFLQYRGFSMEQINEVFE